MRLNQYLAQATGLSRRAADQLIVAGRVMVDGKVAELGTQVDSKHSVTIDSRSVEPQNYRTIMLHKPAGYVTSRTQQGKAPTIYDLLPAELHQLKPVGRLDKDSSGLLLLTNDGQLAQRLSHPSVGKWKHYIIKLNRPLTDDDLGTLRKGVELEDGISRLDITPAGRSYSVKLQEGRNRQIRRSLEALGYRVTKLHRDGFGEFQLGRLAMGQWHDANKVGIIR